MLNLNALIPEKITLNSREVAPMVNVRHDHLIRNIDTYINQMKEANKIANAKLRSSVNEEPPNLGSRINPKDYFIKSSYISS